jgi:isopentenyl-diphosphate delta-isomerase
MTDTPDISARKREHIETVLNEDVAAKGVTTGFELFQFDHCALPEFSLDRIDLSVEIFGRRLAAPLLISSMTGGTERAHKINLSLAEAAQELGIAMAVGSQRAAIEQDDLAESYRVRRAAPDILLFANIGAVQLNYGFGADQARRAVDMIEADALFLHLNPLQEAVQAEGDRDWRGLLNKIESLVAALDIPVVIKEVGAGLSGATARQLADAGVAAIDVAGAGGTSWSEVEAKRQPDPFTREVAHAFVGWGIPTAFSLRAVREAVPDLPVFASGGLRSGIDVAKSIRLGATLCGLAAPVLGSATEGAEAVRHRMAVCIQELRIAAFCTGSIDLAALRSAPLRRLADWSLLKD